MPEQVFGETVHHSRKDPFKQLLETQMKERDASPFREILAHASRMPPEQRAAYLNSACSGDTPLRRKIESILGDVGSADRPPGDVTGPTAELCADRTEASGLTADGPGSRIGRYKLLQLIGEGGFGSVFMAEQQSPVTRKVALKIIKLGMDTRQVIARFEAERQALALMDHPSIAKVFDAGTTKTGRPYFVMELVRGTPITEYCDAQKLTTRRRIELFVQVCHAIQHAHQKGIIHRDIKPSNVLVTMHDDVPVPKVIDFGIAKATAAPLTDKTLFTEFRQFMGTPAYMSPEQAQLNGLDVDTRSDIYSLGVLLYELLTGTTPFTPGELKMAAYDEIRRMIRDVEPPRPSTRISSLAVHTLATLAGQRQSDPKRLKQTLCGDLDWIVMKSLEKDRARRYETANGLAQDIQRHLRNEPIVARPPSSAYRVKKFAQRNRLLFGAAATISAILILGICVSTFEAVRAAHARDAWRRAELTQEQMRQVAETERAQAENSRRQAQRERAQGLVSEADALQMAGRWWEARQTMEESYTRFVEAGASPLSSRLGLYALTAGSPASLMTFKGHNAPVKCMAVSPDGRTVISGSGDGMLILWDLAIGRPIRTFHGHEGGVSTVNWSPDGRSVISAGPDRMVKLWDVSSAREVRRFLGHTDDITQAVLSPDGQTAVSFSCDSTIRFWDVARGSELRQLRAQGALWHASMSSNGQTIGACGYRFAQLWDVASGRLLCTIDDDDNVLDVQFSGDGKTVVTASGDSQFQIYKLSGELVRTFSGHTSGVTSAVFSSDGKRILSGSRDHTARLWSVDTGELLHVFVGHGDGLTSAAFLSDGQTILTSSYDRTLRRWSLSGMDVRTFPLTWPVVRAVAFSPDDRIVLTANVNTCALWDAATGQQLRSFPAYVTAPYGAMFSPDGRSVVFQVDVWNMGLWDIATGRQIRVFPNHAIDGIAAAFSPDGRVLVTGGADHELQMWDLATGKLLHTLSGHTAEIFAIAFTSDGQFIVSGSSDGDLRVWDVASGRHLRTLRGHHSAVLCLAITRDGRFCLSGGLNNTLILWDIGTGQALRTFVGHTDAITGVAFRPEENTAYSVSLDKTLKLWDIASSREIYSVNAGSIYNCLAVSSDGNQILSGRPYGISRLGDIGRFEQTQSLQEKLDRAQQELQASPNNPASLALLGRWWAFRGIYNFAADCLERARERGGPVPNLILARCYWALHRYSDAKREFTFALAGSSTASERLSLQLCLHSINESISYGGEAHRFAGQKNNVYFNAFSPDDRTSLSCGPGGQVILWDNASGTEIRAFAGHSGDVNSVAFSPDGQTAVTAGADKTVRLWTISTGKLLRTFTGHTARVQSAVFSPDGQAILSGGEDKSLILWNASTGQVIRRLSGHTGTINVVAFTHDGRNAISGSEDRTARIWEIVSGRQLRALSPHNAGVLALAVSSDDRRIATGCQDWLMRCWDWGTEGDPAFLYGHTGYVTGSAFSPDGRIAYSCGVDGKVKMWDLATSSVIHTFDVGSRLQCISLSHNGRQFLVGDDAGSIWLQDIGQPAK